MLLMKRFSDLARRDLVAAGFSRGWSLCSLVTFPYFSSFVAKTFKLNAFATFGLRAKHERRKLLAERRHGSRL
jgi:hypothetical protein